MNFSFKLSSKVGFRPKLESTLMCCV